MTFITELDPALVHVEAHGAVARHVLGAELRHELRAVVAGVVGDGDGQLAQGVGAWWPNQHGAGAPIPPLHDDQRMNPSDNTREEEPQAQGDAILFFKCLFNATPPEK